MSSWILWLILSLDSITNIVCVFVLLFITLITSFFAIFIAEGSHAKYHVVYKMGINFFKKLAVVTSFVLLV